MCDCFAVGLFNQTSVSVGTSAICYICLISKFIQCLFSRFLHLLKTTLVAEEENSKELRRPVSLSQVSHQQEIVVRAVEVILFFCIHE